MTDRKIYKRRKLHGLRAPSDPYWVQLGDPESSSLSAILDSVMERGADRLYLCGSLEQMSRAYIEEPLSQGWEFARSYVHKYRSPVYRESLAGEFATPEEARARKQISVKLVSESWFPDCENILEAIPAWRALKATWEQDAKLPLLSTPAASGRALLWEMLPKDEAFPALPDELAQLIRRVSPQHRSEWIQPGDTAECFQYDGRWMYASLATLDRLPIGEPVRVEKFEPYAPGWYRVQVSAPSDWKHIGLIPFADGEGDWVYPVVAEDRGWFETWASEPELTLALKYGWKVEVLEGWAFTQGRPLGQWAKKLIAMRDQLTRQVQLRDSDRDMPARILAGAAIRNVLNHTIGSLHVDGFEREQFISNEKWREWFKANEDYIARTGEYYERAEQDGVKGRLVRSIVPDNSPIGIYMPHWSATIWALERARVAEWALKCDPRVLVKIQGDAIYSTAELPLKDNDNLGQPRRKR